MDDNYSGGSTEDYNSDTVDSFVPEGQGEDSTEVIDSDNFSGMQNRMAKDDDAPWFSKSVGKVVTTNGDVVIDPKTGKHFSNMEEFREWERSLSKEPPKQEGKPENKQVVTNKQEPIMSKPFDHYFGDLTPKKMAEVAGRGSDYKYNDELVPTIDTTAIVTQEDKDIDPVKQVQENRANWEAITIKPLETIYQELVAQGANPQAAAELLRKPYEDAKALVEGHYQEQYQKALENKLSKPLQSQKEDIETRELVAKSDNNINSLAQKYFPEGGKDAFFALVSGHRDEKGNWVRGEASGIMDMLISTANGGKKYSSESDRENAYSKTFRQLTSDPIKAGVMFDIVKNYWLGKNFNKAKQEAFNSAKQSTQRNEQVKLRTFKPKPTSNSNPNEDDDGTPSVLKRIMKANY